MGSLIFGAYVLKVFGLSVPVVQVAGGAVLCALGWNLLNSDTPPPPTADAADATRRGVLRAFYPLTLPLTVDPGRDLRGHHARRQSRPRRRARAGRLLPRIIGTAIISLRSGSRTATRSAWRAGSAIRA